MKIEKIILVIIALLLSSVSQSECPWGKTSNSLLTTDTNIIGLDTLPKKKFVLSLFEDHEFQNDKDYKLVIEQELSNDLLVIEDFLLLQELQTEYVDVENYFIHVCDSIPESKIAMLLILDKKRSEFYQYDSKCGVLITQHGSIKFNIELLLNSGRRTTFKSYEEEINSASELDIRLNKLQNSKKVLLYDVSPEFAGQLDFIYNDADELVVKILSDTCWSNMVDESMSVDFKPPVLENESEDVAYKIGQILQLLIRQKSKGGRFKLISWREIDNVANNYLVTIGYTNESHPPIIEEISSFKNVSKYKLNYLREN